MLGKGEAERRTTRRFPIEQAVRYKVLVDRRTVNEGCGATVNMSSAGIWFTTDQPLSLGVEVELAMNWPVLLDGSLPMKLLIFGSVLRSNDRGAAVAIERYEFRTRSSRAECAELKQLEDEHHKAGAAFDSARARLRERIGISDRDEYERLDRVADAAWQALNKARKRLHERIREQRWTGDQAPG